MIRLIRWFFGGVLIGAGAIALVYLGMSLNEKQQNNSFTESNAPARTVWAERPTVHHDELYENRKNAITSAISEASPAVVSITVTQIRVYRSNNPLYDDPFFRHFFNIPERVYRDSVENLGSGFIISPDGYVITNEHVVHNASEIMVNTTDTDSSKGKKYLAELVGTDFDSDLALLKIQAENLPHLPLANDEDAIVGEWVIAIGNPFGLFDSNHQPSVSVGVVSALGRDFERNEDGRLYRDMIQTDAAINPGNSGGPLLNVNNEVIGVNTFIFTQSGGSVGVGFAIPAQQLKSVISRLQGRDQLDKDFYTGLMVQDINRRIALSLNFKSTNGIIVTEIEPGSPAEKAGLEPADIIFSVGGTPIPDVQSIQIYFSNRDLRVGDTVVGKYFRKGKEYNFKMTLEARKQ